MTYSEVIKIRIEYYLKERQLTVNRLANMCGVPQSTLDHLMHGGPGVPTLKTIHKVANGLGMTISEFLDYKEMNEFSFE